MNPTLTTKNRFTILIVSIWMQASAFGAIAIELDPVDFVPTGELFLSVYDSASNASYTRDLGINSSFRNFQTSELTFTPDALFTSTFSQSDPANLRYAITAVANDSFDLQIKAWTTSNSDNVEFATDALLTMQVVLAALSDHVDAINASIPTTDINENLSTVITDSSSDGHYTNPATFNESLASAVVFNTGEQIGVPIKFHSLAYSFAFEEPQIVEFANVWTLATDGTLTYAPPAETDTDADGVVDALDNCIETANAVQTDSDGDGHGNACDTDLNNDCITNVVDLGLLRLVFFSSIANADFNSDGTVNVADLGIFRAQFLRVPGPSAAGLCN